VSSTCPDIIFACSSLSSVQNMPTHEHWEILIKLCQYIKTTIHYGILYCRSTQETIKPIGYVNADWANNCANRCSISSYVFTINGSPVSWSSKSQSIVALSSTESEYVSLARGVQQAVWMRSWFEEVMLGDKDPTNLMCDNLGAISLSEMMKEHAISKAIDVRYHFI
jgi:hypothetical protein